MDQIKIGAFIAECRRKKSLTQKALADMLYISDKAVSKWERGRGVPDISLMIPLCDVLDISVAELLRGERLVDEARRKREEEEILRKMDEERQNKRNIILCSLIVALTLLSGITLIMVASHLEMEVWQRIALIVVSFLVISGGIAIVTVLDINIGIYECRHCGARFKPSFGAYFMGAHTITTRWLKCPECGKSSMCRRRLSR